MLTVNKLLPQGRGLAPALLKRAAAVVLDWDTRQKSRFDTEDSQGRKLGVFLPRGNVVRGGDVLVTEDGSLVKVIATPQPVLVVRTSAHGTPFDLLRAAYHLGNRHVALELQADRLQLEPDHVLADMLRQMHLAVTEELAPFEPEAGAYAAHASHGHGHAHDHAAHGAEAAKAHDHDHDHDHTAPSKGVDAAPSHGHEGHGHGHVHGPGCGHDHH
jgi:urease accessory protein